MESDPLGRSFWDAWFNAEMRAARQFDEVVRLTAQAKPATPVLVEWPDGAFIGGHHVQ